MRFLDFENETIRREILGILEQDPDYAVPDEILQKCLQARAMSCSADRLNTQLHWLSENGLVTLETVAGNVFAARLTRRGEDVALSRAVAPGVARARPE